MRTLTKMFIESRYEERKKGAAPDEWEHVSHTESIDVQVKDWVTATAANVISVSAPGISQVWANSEMTLKCILVGYVVIYTPAEDDSEPAGDDIT